MCDFPYPDYVYYKKGDYIKIDEVKYGYVNCINGWSFKYKDGDWTDSSVELMPEGFDPDNMDVIDVNNDLIYELI